MKNVLICNDPTRQDDNSFYLCSKLIDLLGEDNEVRVVSFIGFDDVANYVAKMLGELCITVELVLVPFDYKDVTTVTSNVDYVLLMPNDLLDKEIGDIWRKTQTKVYTY